MCSFLLIPSCDLAHDRKGVRSDTEVRAISTKVQSILTARTDLLVKGRLRAVKSSRRALSGNVHRCWRRRSSRTAHGNRRS